jgi:very-short-patch-repair endonuclease
MGIKNYQYYYEKFKEKHGEKYTYPINQELSDGCNTKIKIICPIHGEFHQRIYHHIRGNCCPKCSIDERRKSWVNYLLDFNKIHKNKYKYDDNQILLNGNRTKIKIICPTHGEFYQILSHHSQGVGCPQCSYEIIGEKNSKTYEYHIIICKKVHGNFYSYPDYQIIKNNKTKIKIMCPVHGEFYQMLSEHQSGKGCSKCNESKGEKKIRIFLENNNIKYESQYKFENCKNKCMLKYDFYIPTLNVCIEYDGEFHFHPARYSKNKEKMINKLNETIKNDKIKNEFCMDNNIPLLRIPYWEFKNINEILKDFFKLK